MFPLSQSNYRPPSLVKRWNLVSAPTEEPVTVTDYIDYQRVKTADVKESVVMDKLMSARERVEQYTKHAIVNQTWDLFLDVAPGLGSLTGWSWARFFGFLQETPLEFPKSPFITLIGCYVTDDTGTESTVDSSTYWISRAVDPGRLALRQDFSWPDTGARSFETFRARFVCGYLTPFTIADDSVTIMANDHGKAVGDMIRVTNRDGSIPSPLQERTNYFVVDVPDSNSLKISATANGSAITFTDGGTGVQFIGVLPSQFRRAILLTASEDKYGAGAQEKRKSGASGRSQSQQSNFSEVDLPEDAVKALRGIRILRIA